MRALTWAVLCVVGAVGCGPVAIRALDPTNDGGVSDVANPSDGGGARCTENAQCGAGQYCAGNGCGTAGTCAVRPQACTLEYAPVCGCDGRTYGNACAAANAGVRVERSGTCATPTDGGVDGGPGACVTNEQCGLNSQCVYPRGNCARSGTCQPMTACFRAETFCGCDGQTYEGCEPDRPTRSVGPCVPSADGGVDAGPARCTINAQCAAGQYCAGEGCGTPGTCATRPEACTLEYAPVCGCDGRTHGNACAAAGAGTRVASRGECTTVDAGVDGGGRACTSNAECPGTYYCEGTGCGTAGVCTPRPEVCTREYVPVCGCDGRTYGNACGAASQGVRVASRGECAGSDGGSRICTTSSECGANGTCVYPDNLCARSGSCQPTIACLRAETFCGCDGQSYQGCVPDRPTRARGPCVSRCAAILCGPGSTCCEATGECYDFRNPALCPGAADAGVAGCGSNADCAAGSYCRADACGARGACTPRPEACITLWAPVCGCDGRTYGNSCEAAAGGTNVAAQGACR